MRDLKNNEEEAEIYLLGPRQSTGRKKLLTSDARSVVFNELNEFPCHSLSSLLRSFAMQYYANGIEDIQCPSISTIHRVLQKGNFTRKVVERRNIRRDENECFFF